MQVKIGNYNFLSVAENVCKWLQIKKWKLSGGQKVWWLTPGWIIYRNLVFQDWDKGKANENFPQHTGGAILLDGIGFWEKYSEEQPEKVLEFSDWMGIEIRPYEITLDRLKNE